MKINLIILTALILLTAGWTWQSNRKNNLITENVETLAPDFSYTTIKGLESSLHVHKGKIIFLHFWASWCAPCLVEFPDLLKLAESQKDNLVILAVSTDETKSDIYKFLKQLKTEIPQNVQIIQDVDKVISQDLYQSVKLPETFVILPDHTPSYTPDHTPDYTPDYIIAEKIIGPQENWNSIIWQRKILRLQKQQ